MIRDNHIRDFVSGYYADKIRTYGTSAQGVDWKDETSQNLRFDVLRQLFAHDPQASVADLGCGYGAFLPYIRNFGYTGKYIGLDICPEMIDAAQKAANSEVNAVFKEKLEEGETCDYIVSSGIFNVRENIDDAKWLAYIRETLDWKNRHAVKGFAFNALTSYSDAERMVSRLYYADGCALFDLCKRNYSRHVALLHDYGLYEFTIIVRKAL